MNNYVPYHMHTDYSLVDSCTKPQDYIDRAVECGIRAIAFSEHGIPLNWTEKWGACKKAGIQYIHAVEMYLTRSHEEKVRDNYHTVLIAKNMDGVHELNELVHLSSQPSHFYYKNRISFDEFLAISDNIISTSACLASPLNRLDKDDLYFDKLARKYTYFEVQYHDCTEQKDFNRLLLRLSERYGKPLIAGTDTHSLNQYKAECRKVLILSKHKGRSTVPFDDFDFDLTFKTYNDLVEAFEKQHVLPSDIYLKAIENTNEMASQVEEIELDTSIKYPILYGTRENDSKRFVEVISEKFDEKCKTGVIPPNQVNAFKDAITEELRVFQKLKMDGFMLSMSELISWCKSQGMAIGTARGSVGGSRIAYITDIIDLNPETWHTVFSRFCNEDREEIGDIDIDCVADDRPKIFEYIINRFGIEKTARVASFGTLQDKAVIDVVGKYLAKKWENEHRQSFSVERSSLDVKDDGSNPWSLKNIELIKRRFNEDESSTKSDYPELFYYLDGLLDTKVSQSVHSAGIVISPIDMISAFGTFNKDGENCLLLDMENVHDYTGLAKYDFLILKTVQVISDTCKYIGTSYPKTNEIDWDDEAVWEDIISDPTGIFQFEGSFAFECLKKFKPRSIFDMSIVTACIRPSGTSYRDALLARKVHKNPSEIIDNLLKDNLGYLIYQEDTIKFLQQVCGLSGSQADNIRRAIGRKQKDRLDAAMPSILDGYCSKSPKSRLEAEEEAKEFLQIIEDSASYQFGYNHSIAYCLLGYLCAYYRHYYPMEFITSFMNNAANDDDVKNGSAYAGKYGIKISMPKWGISKSDYFFDKASKTIAKGVSSIKQMGHSVGDDLYDAARGTGPMFVDVLNALNGTNINSRQIDALIKIDYFSDFGNQKELMRIYEMYTDIFKKGTAKQINKQKVAGTIFESIIQKYSVGTTRNGSVSKSYILLDIDSMMRESETAVLKLGLDDFDNITKAKNFADITGYPGFVSGKEADRRVLYLIKIIPLRRKSDGKQFGYSFITKSLGSGIESRFTVNNAVFNYQPVKEGDFIQCNAWDRDRQYFVMLSYKKI